MYYLLENFVFDNIQPNYKSMVYLQSLNESEVVNISDNLVAALYKSAVERYNKLDYGDIPESKGDITRLKDYETIKASIELLRQLQQKTGVLKIEELDVVERSFNHMNEFRKEFTLGFIQNNQMIMMIYNTVVMSILCGMIVLINTMIEYIKSPTGEFESVLAASKESKPDSFILMRNLENFNGFVEKGDLKRLFSQLNQKEQFVGTAALATVATIALLTSIVPIIRELIYFAYNFRMTVAEYIDIQASFLELNANALKFNDNIKTVESKKTVIQNQERIAKKLRATSTKVRGKLEVADSVTKKELSKKVDVDSVKVNVDNSVGFSLV